MFLFYTLPWRYIPFYFYFARIHLHSWVKRNTEELVSSPRQNNPSHGSINSLHCWNGYNVLENRVKDTEYQRYSPFLGGNLSLQFVTMSNFFRLEGSSEPLNPLDLSQQ